MYSVGQKTHSPGTYDTYGDGVDTCFLLQREMRLVANLDKKQILLFASIRVNY